MNKRIDWVFMDRDGEIDRGSIPASNGTPSCGDDKPYNDKDYVVVAIIFKNNGIPTVIAIAWGASEPADQRSN